MPVDVSSQIDIRLPRQQVAAYAGNPDNIPKWYVNIRSVDWKTTPPIGLGSQIAFVAQFLGRRLEYTYEVVKFLPDECLVMRTSEGPFPMETSYVWEVVTDNLTRMTLRNRGEPAGFSRLFAPFMAMAIRRANRKDLRLLKQMLEKTDE